jgi:hypothetical protein
MDAIEGRLDAIGAHLVEDAVSGCPLGSHT